MWNFNDSKRNMVFKKSDMKNMINCSLSQKYRTHSMSRIEQKWWQLFRFEPNLQSNYFSTLILLLVLKAQYFKYIIHTDHDSLISSTACNFLISV